MQALEDVHVPQELTEAAAKPLLGDQFAAAALKWQELQLLYVTCPAPCPGQERSADHLRTQVDDGLSQLATSTTDRCSSEHGPPKT